MTRFRNTYTTLTTFVSAAVLLISTTVPASASPMASDPLSSSTTTAVRAQVTALGANRTYTYVPTNNTSVGDPIVTAYWTPERMKSAIPADTPTSTTEVNRQIDELEQPALADEPVTDGSSPVTVEEQILIAIDDRIIALAPEHMTRTGIDGHATGAQNAQLFVHTPVGLAQRHGFDLPQSGDESAEATPHPRDGLSEPNEVQPISLLQNSANPPRMQSSRTSNEMKPPYHYSKDTRRSIKATTRKTQTPPKRDDAHLHETCGMSLALSSVCTNRSKS